MTFQRLLASLVLFTFLVGHPFAADPLPCPDCATAAAPALNGCCDVADMPSCALSCSAAPAAVGDARAKFLPLDPGSPLDSAARTLQSFSRPPDTAPPKVLSA